MKIQKALIFFVAFLSILLTGCATAPTAQELASIDYGSYPTDHKKSVERYLDSTLKDPDSKRIEWLRGPQTMWSKGGALAGVGMSAGYAVCAYVNAKNSFGGYTGAKLSWFLIKNDRVIQAFISTSRGSTETLSAESACSSSQWK
jgi:hypothetical protein